MEFSHTVLWVFDLFLVAVSIKKACSETLVILVYTDDLTVRVNLKNVDPVYNPHKLVKH